MVSDEQKVINIIGQTEYDQVKSIVPDKYNVQFSFDINSHLITLSDQQVLEFYADLINDTTHTSSLKSAGAIIVLTSNINELLISLVNAKETDVTIKQTAQKISLHYLILLCTSKYNFPEDLMTELMELKHYRNMVAHKFNDFLSQHIYEHYEYEAKGMHLLIQLKGYF